MASKEENVTMTNEMEDTEMKNSSISSTNTTNNYGYEKSDDKSNAQLDRIEQKLDFIMQMLMNLRNNA